MQWTPANRRVVDLWRSECFPIGMDIAGDVSDHDSNDAEDAISLPSDNDAEDLMSLPSDIDDCEDNGSDSLGSHDVAEVFSPPRVVPVAQSVGLHGKWSLDLDTGFDLTLESVQSNMWEILDTATPKVIVISPPCTFYSAANRVWNKGKISVDEWERRRGEANILLHLAMQVCTYQYHRNAGFVFEHPSGASSWTDPEVESVKQLRGVRRVIFDGCAVGHRSKVDRWPVKKSTALLTNIPEVEAKFTPMKCRCRRQMIDGKMQKHRVIMGFEGGMSRSRFAQLYPVPMVRLLVAAIHAYVSH